MATYQDTKVEDPRGLALLVPGVAYPVQMPQMYFAKQVVLSHRYNVREMTWDTSMQWTPQAVRAEVEKALEGNPLPVLIVGKSIGSLASLLAAEDGYPAIWMTPVAERDDVVDAIGRNPAAQLAIGGTEDPHWNAEAAAQWPSHVRVVEFEGADHPLLVAGNVVRSAQIVAEYTKAMDEWLSALK
ncbi:MAG: hypothetical protein SPI12_06150 [Actinomycetaceae bacterium]|nr:hypothetical protein [Actinomycetaceae bacterium]MDY6083418.1 hypothetical protein [Actinomycetaceae bacterium]